MLRDRVNEHSRNIRAYYENSLIYQHCANLNHEMKLEDDKILIQSSQTRPRRYLEAFFSLFNENSFNRHLCFSDIYKPIIKELTS